MGLPAADAGFAVGEFLEFDKIEISGFAQLILAAAGLTADIVEGAEKESDFLTTDNTDRV